MVKGSLLPRHACCLTSFLSFFYFSVFVWSSSVFLCHLTPYLKNVCSLFLLNVILSFVEVRWSLDVSTEQIVPWNKETNSIHIFLFCQDPGDSRPMLLVGGSDRIVIAHLNGTGLQPLRSLSVNGTLALDFQHNQESVCWVLSAESSGHLRCAETRNLRGFTREQEIRTQQSLQRTFSALRSFPLLHLSW